MRVVLFFALLPLSLSVSGPMIDVPRAAAPQIDGRIDKAEWANADPDRLSDGSVIRLQHDGRHLFLAIEAVGSGFSSLCVAGGNTVRILHASAALGAVTYARSGAEWTTKEQKFVFAMRNRALDDSARAERAAYLKEHGWVASTAPMSQGRVQELQIALATLGATPRVALGFFVDGSSERPAIATWPQSMPGTDGCANTQLVSGNVPTPLAFQAETWATLRMR